MAYSHQDGRVTATPENGPNAKKPFAFDSNTKVSFDPGLKRSYAKAYRQRPGYIATQAAEPKLSIDFSSAREVHRFLKHFWGGQKPQRGLKLTISHVFSRLGVPTESWRYFQCEISSGGGYDSDDNGVASKLEFMLLDAHLDGVSIYEDPA